MHICYHYSKKKISFEGARPEKGLKFWPFSKRSKSKTFIFEYFSKIPSEMNMKMPHNLAWLIFGWIRIRPACLHLYISLDVSEGRTRNQTSVQFSRPQFLLYNRLALYFLNFSIFRLSFLFFLLTLSFTFFLKKILPAGHDALCI